MPELDLNFLKKIKDFKLEDYPCFFETGTYMGNTILYMDQYFEKLYTVEIKEQLLNDVKSKYTGNKINFYLGDSSIMLPKLVKRINKNTIFFLDGHWSAGITGKGKKDCPLYEELNGIMKNFKHKAIIIIDDFRLFGLGPNTTNGKEVCNWEDISRENVLNIVEKRLDDEYHLPSELHPKDRFVLHLNSL
tara:strand:- start:419 stop:988 length:570 start_codon:yes stop_codon:yes gene_type:complete